MLVCLLYVSLVTPYQAVFIQEKLSWDVVFSSPMFWVNIGVDLLFLIDMIFNFYVKVTIETHSGRVSLHTRKDIARNYLRGWFIIDFLSILPIDIVTSLFLPYSGLMQNESFTKDLKAIKLIRLFRLLKLLRVVRSSRIIKRWESHSGVTYKNRQLDQLFIQAGGVGPVLGLRIRMNY